MKEVNRATVVMVVAEGFAAELLLMLSFMLSYRPCASLRPRHRQYATLRPVVVVSVIEYS